MKTLRELLENGSMGGVSSGSIATTVSGIGGKRKGGKKSKKKPTQTIFCSRIDNGLPINETTQLFYHGSLDYLPVGTILTPRKNYDEQWNKNILYRELEKYRPKNMLSHAQSVFMCDNDEDIGSAGGGTAWLFTVQPLGIVQKHDVNWGGEISMCYDNGEVDMIKQCAENYWNSVATYSPLWEYLTPLAKIIAVEKYI